MPLIRRPKAPVPPRKTVGTVKAAAQPKGFDYAALARAFAEGVMPQQAPRPTFDASGLYNDADARAQGEAEFNPYFGEQESNRLRDVQREREALARQQQDDTGQLQSDYLNRGLSRSGAAIGAQQDLVRRQALAQAMGQESAIERAKALTQKRAAALEDYRNSAYNRAYQRYLGLYA